MVQDSGGKQVVVSPFIQCMHELSIAVSLIEAAETRAAEEGAKRISRLYLRIGPLSGVVPEALASAFELASQSTQAYGAELEIEEVPIAVYCPGCDRVVDVDGDFSFQCPRCGQLTHDIRRGNEMELTMMEIE